MIFYETISADGVKQLAPTQADARAIDRNFTQVDLPTDKAGYMNYVNGLLARISELEKIGGSAPAVAPEEPQEQRSEPQPVAEPSQDPPPVRPEPEPEPVDYRAAEATMQDLISAFGPDQLAPVVEAAMERVGHLGEEAFMALDLYHARNGVGAGFSRGVHVLSTLCMGEHQLTRLLFRARKTDRKWGA